MNRKPPVIEHIEIKIIEILFRMLHIWQRNWQTKTVIKSTNLKQVIKND